MTEEITIQECLGCGNLFRGIQNCPVCNSDSRIKHHITTEE